MTLNPYQNLGLSSESMDYSDKIHPRRGREDITVPQPERSIHAQHKKEQKRLKEEKVHSSSLGCFKCFGK